MTLTKPNDSISEIRPIQTHFGLPATQSAREIQVAEHRFTQWNSMIEMLRGWQADPRRAIDDDYEPPSQAAISRALWIARAFRDSGDPSATRMSPIGDGGIAFEWRRDRTSHELEVTSAAVVEYREYVDCKIVRSRKFWTSAS
jgi:hypothetical protein